MNLVTSPTLYANNGRQLMQFISDRETVSQRSGRYAYGKLEFPFTLPQLSPDKTTSSTPFPPGQFHLDTFTGNANLTSFYLNTLVPLFKSPTSFFFHLDKSTQNDDAALNLDATLLALISHR